MNEKKYARDELYRFIDNCFSCIDMYRRSCNWFIQSRNDSTCNIDYTHCDVCSNRVYCDNLDHLSLEVDSLKKMFDYLKKLVLEDGKDEL